MGNAWWVHSPIFRKCVICRLCIFLVHMSGNRLHCLGGTQGDRHSTAIDDWSFEIRNGRTIQDSWKLEPPLPEACNHTASYLVGSKLFVLGDSKQTFRQSLTTPITTVTLLNQ